MTIAEEAGRTAAPPAAPTGAHQAQHNAHLAAIVRATQDAIISTDLDDRIQSWNPGAERLFGYSEAEAVGRTVEELIVPDDKRAIRRERYANYAKRPVPLAIETQRVRKDGVCIEVEVDGSPMLDGSGAVIGVSLIMRDISARNRALRELTEAKARLTLALDIARAGTWESVPATGELIADDTALALHGWAPGTPMTRQRGLDAVHPDDRAKVEQGITRTLETGERFLVEVRIVLADGSIRWVRSQAERMLDRTHPRLVGMIQDITAGKLVELERAAELAAMERLRRLGALSTSTGELEPLLAEIVETARAISGSDLANIQLLDPADGDLRIAAHTGFPQAWLDYWNHAGKGTCGSALAVGERVIVEDLAASPTFAGTPALAAQLSAGIRAMQSTPLVSRTGRPVGAISTHHYHPHQWDVRTLRVLDLLARQAADIIVAKQTEEALRESEARQAMLLALSDRLHNVTDPEQIRAEATRIVGEGLGVVRAAFFQIEGADYVIPADYVREGQSIAGRWPTQDFGQRLLALQSRGEPVVVPDVAGFHTHDEAERFASVGIRAYLNVPLVREGQFITALAVHSATPRAWTPGEISLLREVAERTWAELERSRAEAALRAAHDTFRRMIDTSPFGIYVVDSDFRLAQVSAGAQKVFENVRPLIGRDLTEAMRILWTEPFATEVIARFRHTLATGEPYHAPSTVEMRSDTDETESYDWQIERMILPDGRPGVVCHFYDLSERQRHEEHVRLLMREVNHRAKNMLGLIQAIARQTVATRPTDFIERFERRLRALSANQDVLVRSEWHAVPLRELVISQVFPFNPEGDPRVSLSGPDIRITAAAAQTLGMAVHELATNAAKHGALSVENGRVEVGWALGRNAAGADEFTMTWRERGGPRPAEPVHHGFGWTVIDRMIRMSFGCQPVIHFAPGGLEWSIACAPAKIVEGAIASPSPVPVTAPAAPALAPRQDARGKRVLVVEDEGLIAMEIAAIIASAGMEAVGPASTCAEALALLAQDGCDAAVLDINLATETSEAVAERLIADGTPFVVVSGYSTAQQPALLRAAPLIEKPVEHDRLVAELNRLLAPEPAATAP